MLGAAGEDVVGALSPFLGDEVARFDLKEFGAEAAAKVGERRRGPKQLQRTGAVKARVVTRERGRQERIFAGEPRDEALEVAIVDLAAG